MRQLVGCTYCQINASHWRFCSRLKKIKCLQSSSEAKCKACSQAKVSCRFRDREKYFAERSQFIGGPPSESPSPCRGGLQTTSLYNHLRYDVAADVDTMFYRATSTPLRTSSSVMSWELLTEFRWSDNPPQPFNPSENIENTNRYASSSCNVTSISKGWTYFRWNQLQDVPASAADLMDDFLQFEPSRGSPDPLVSFQILNNITPFSHRQDTSIPLFDPNQPQSPHSAFMPHFIEIFIQNLGAQFPFVNYDDTLERYINGKLSPLLSNSIASLASRYARRLCSACRYLTPR